MNDRKYFEGVGARPVLYGLDGSYKSAVMFLIGFDEARSGGLLRGFTEWLVVCRGECSGFGWQALVLDEALPGIGSWGWNKLDGSTSEQEREAVDACSLCCSNFNNRMVSSFTRSPSVPQPLSDEILLNSTIAAN